jgi:hypothetical protein
MFNGILWPKATPVTDSQFTSELRPARVIPVLALDKLTACAAATWPDSALKVKLEGIAIIVPLVPVPVPTLKVTVIVVALPAPGVTVMCPVYVAFVRVAALADTARVAGLAEPTVKLPLVTAAVSQV